MTVPSKHIKTLTRRLKYLEGLKKEKEANSFDLAEIAALRTVLEFVKCSAPSYESPTLTQYGGALNED